MESARAECLLEIPLSCFINSPKIYVSWIGHCHEELPKRIVGVCWAICHIASEHSEPMRPTARSCRMPHPCHEAVKAALSPGCGILIFLAFRGNSVSGNKDPRLQATTEKRVRGTFEFRPTSLDNGAVAASLSAIELACVAWTVTETWKRGKLRSESAQSNNELTCATRRLIIRARLMRRHLRLTKGCTTQYP